MLASILLVSYVVIYFLYADFKEDEFFLRLEQKALTTYKLLVEVKEVDQELLQIIDRNTLNALYDEKVLVFDHHHKLIYSSLDDHAITYNDELLNKIESEELVKYSDGGREVVGILVKSGTQKGIVIASANDQFGKAKLQNLLYILVFSYLAALLISAFLSYFYVKQAFAPIEILNKQITRIRQNRLNERVPVTEAQDELNLLAINFNKMLERIEAAFNVQRSFIQHASHELRTPLANLITSCEAALNRNLTNEQYRELIESLNEEHHNLVELTNALLMLSKYEGQDDGFVLGPIRGDELLFQIIEDTQTLFPDHIIHFNFDELPTDESELTISGNEVLLKTALLNLMRNACKYTDNGQVTIQLVSLPQSLRFEFTNSGPTLDDDEIKMMWHPFFRGRNVTKQKGYGLGLAITKRIVDLFKGSLIYQKSEQSNCFAVDIPKHTLREI
jgi:signal transduction histidine kinase